MPLAVLRDERAPHAAVQPAEPRRRGLRGSRRRRSLHPGPGRQGMLTRRLQVLNVHAHPDPRRPHARAGRRGPPRARRARTGWTAASRPATSRRAPRTTCSWPRTIPWRASSATMILARAAAQPAVRRPRRCRCASFRRSSIATRAGSRSAITSTTPIRQVPGTPHAHPHRSVGDAVPRASPTNTTAASCWSRTPTACTA